MNRGSRSRCHRAFFTVVAVALCLASAPAALAQTRRNFASSLTSESITVVLRRCVESMKCLQGLRKVSPSCELNKSR